MTIVQLRLWYNLDELDEGARATALGRWFRSDTGMLFGADERDATFARWKSERSTEARAALRNLVAMREQFESIKVLLASKVIVDEAIDFGGKG